MALSNFFKNALILKQKPQVLSLFLQQNGMSQYPEYFIRPVHRKEQQTDLIQSGEIQKFTHLPTRAALSDQTCSVYHDDTINLFINYTMRKGQKALARTIVEKAFEKVKRIQLEKYHKASDEVKSTIELSPKVIFHEAVKNSTPILQLTPIKRGGVRYQVPVPINERRARFLSMKWLIEAAQDKEKPVHFPDQLARELIDAAANTGRVVKRKQELHRQCEANRAYAHYRWS